MTVQLYGLKNAASVHGVVYGSLALAKPVKEPEP